MSDLDMDLETRRLYNSTVIPTLKEMMYCLNATKRINCLHSHPVCLHSIVNNTLRVKTSPACRDGCEKSMENVCYNSVNFLRAVNKILDMNPGLGRVNHRRFHIQNCSVSPKLKMENLDDCQMDDIIGTTLVNPS